MVNVIFEEGNFCLRRMEDTLDDYTRMAQWLTDARVLAFYEGRDNPFPLEKIIAKYAPRVLAADGVTPCIMEYECQPIGYLQFYAADASEYNFFERGKIFALDLFIGEPHHWGKGLGTQFLRLLLRYLVEQRGADWVILDPHVDNLRAIRAYEKCGFYKLKLLPKHEQHEGQMVDCWLMGIHWDQVE
jgi:aminoglycoside 6'-N-acetyltransferase